MSAHTTNERVLNICKSDKVEDEYNFLLNNEKKNLTLELTLKLLCSKYFLQVVV